MHARGKSLLPYLIGTVFLLVSCVHRSPYVDEYYFQALGEPGNIVVTVDTTDPGRLPVSVEDPSFAALLRRVDRLSVELYDPHAPDVPGDEQLDAQRLSTYRMRGALEGNIPAFLTNSMLLWSDGWEQVETDTNRYYHHEQLGIDAYAPKNGLLLFANEDFLSHYRSSHKNRVTRIAFPLAERMAQSLFGIYIGSPQAMIDVGLDIPQSVLRQSESLVLVIERNLSGDPMLGGIVTMKSERLANSLSILLKSSYISDKRRNKEPLGDMTDMFVLAGNAVHIEGMALSEAQFASFSAMFGSLASYTMGEKR